MIRTPELELFCDGACKAAVFCRAGGGAAGQLFGGVQQQPPLTSFTSDPLKNLPYDSVLRYVCEKCGWVVKSYSVRFHSIAPTAKDRVAVDVEKIAESPPFSPRTPAKLQRLILPHRELFLKGRRAESEGLGVGAFAYYRRIVEGSKNLLLDEVIRVARHLGAEP